MIVSVYYFVERALIVVEYAFWTAAQAIGLALLDPEMLHRIGVARFENSVYGRKTFANKGLMLFEQEAIRTYFPASGRVVVGAAGGGREMLALHAMGYQVDGFECARTLVDRGRELLREAGCPGRLEWAPPSHAPDWPGPYEAAILGFSGYMYVPARRLRIELLRKFRRMLQPGGVLLLSFEPAKRNYKAMSWAARAANVIRRIRGAEPVLPGDVLQGGFKHWFLHSEIREEMAAAGFEVLRVSWDHYGWAVGRRTASAD